MEFILILQILWGEKKRMGIEKISLKVKKDIIKNFSANNPSGKLTIFFCTFCSQTLSQVFV